MDKPAPHTDEKKSKKLSENSQHSVVIFKIQLKWLNDKNKDREEEKHTPTYHKT